MKIIDVLGGIRIPLSEEESKLVSKVRETGKVLKKSLNERERELARRLVNRGVFLRKVEEKLTMYAVNELEDLWR